MTGKSQAYRPAATAKRGEQAGKMQKIIYLLIIIGQCWVIVLMLLLPKGLEAVEAGNTKILTRIVPDVLDNQTVYPTNHATISLDPVKAYFWQTIEVPETWAINTYYFEIWDSDNEIVPSFASRKLETNHIDITNIDASLYPKIRLIIFAPPSVEPLPFVAPVYFTYTEQNNSRLLVFAVTISLIFIFLLSGAVRYRISLKEFWRESFYLIRGRPAQFSLKQIIIYGLLTVVWSGIFAISLGTFIGGIQILYLLIKLPFILLAALLLSMLANLALSLLVGIRASVKEMVSEAFSIIATIAVTLATFSPIIIFYISIPQNHDQLLISTLFFVGLASVLGSMRFYKWTVKHTDNMILAMAVTGVWLVIYGVVFLQLGWMMRPWVGVIDPVQHTVPFSRLYGGNVFEELFNTLERL